MTEMYLPMISNDSSEPTPPAVRRVVIDPITRIEGHLRIELLVKNGVVDDAWSSSTMFRGVEPILQGRDPRDAWVFAQRLCGVCTTVHAIASVRAVENALGITVPDNARLIRNLLEGSQYIHDHVIHFYHLHALDWVDITRVLEADPTITSDLQKSISGWSNNSPDYFNAVKTRLGNFIASGQLGLFANGYWGHPAMTLPPEADLLAAAHYLEALDFQRGFIKTHAILGGKSPHPQTYLVGGMAIPVHPTNNRALNLTKIGQLRTLIRQALDFVSKVYIPDLLLVADHYRNWVNYGSSEGNYLSFGDFPLDNTNNPAGLWLPRGIVMGNNIGLAPQAVNPDMVKEYVTHSWYTNAEGDDVGQQPISGTTVPNYVGPNPPYEFLDLANKYSWLKAPRYDEMPMEVGPLARMLVAYAAGMPRARELVNFVLAQLSLGPQALFSTLGRVAARGIETLMIAEEMEGWLDQLEANIQANNLTIHNGAMWDPASWPAEAVGWGATEAPRGALGHWVRIQNQQIANYQMVVPSTWNGSPRDAQEQRGAWETALIGTPLADINRPLEVLRTIHSFDPCMACAVHLVDADRKPITSVEIY